MVAQFSAGRKSLLLALHDLVEKASGVVVSAASEARGNVAKRLEGFFRRGVALMPRPMTANEGLELDNPGEHVRLPSGPMFQGIDQECVAGQNTQVRRNLSQVEGSVVDDAKAGLVQDRKAMVLCPPAKVDVFVIEEEVTIQATDLI